MDAIRENYNSEASTSRFNNGLTDSDTDDELDLVIVLSPCVENLTQDQLNEIERSTVEQRKSSRWVDEHAKRLTSSNFGRILTAFAKMEFSESLYKTLLGAYGDLSNLPAVKYGMEKKNQALQMYTDKTGQEVIPSGLRISKRYQFLACSPDGFAGDILIAVKSPFKHKDSNVRRAAREDKVFFLNEDLKLKTWHWYYAQIQGSMFICRKQMTHLVVFVGGEIEIVEVPYEPRWATANVPRLEKFYRENFLPARAKYLRDGRVSRPSPTSQSPNPSRRRRIVPTTISG
jgi:hypothetical protein